MSRGSRPIGVAAGAAAPDPAVADAIAEQTAARVKGVALFAGLHAALAQRNTRPVVIVGAGSSTMEGFEATTEANRMINRLAAYIHAAYPPASGTASAVRTLATAVAAAPLPNGIHVVNAGDAGKSTDTYLTSTTRPQVASLNPSVVLHMGWANDYAGDKDPAVSEANQRLQLSELRAAIAGPCLHVLINPFRRGDAAVVDGTAYPWSAYGPRMKGIAAEFSDVVYVDLQPFYDAASVPEVDPYGLLMANKVHQGDVGHAFMADLLRRELGIPEVTAPVSVAAPANGVVVLDTFNRPDGALGTADTGQAWAATLGSATVAGGKFTVAAAQGSTTCVLNAGFTGNKELGADFVWQGQAMGLLFDSDANSTNRLGVFLFASGDGLQLFKVISNTTTAIATFPFTLTVGTEYRMKVVKTGTSVAVTINGALVTTFTVPTADANATAAGTYAGLRVSTAGSVPRTIDNFYVKKL